jgi:hypothetical protein
METTLGEPAEWGLAPRLLLVASHCLSPKARRSLPFEHVVCPSHGSTGQTCISVASAVHRFCALYTSLISATLLQGGM